MKTAQEMRNITLTRRAEILKELSNLAIQLTHGAISSRIEEEARKGSDCLRYQVGSNYAIHLVEEELQRWGYNVKVNGHNLVITW